MPDTQLTNPGGLNSEAWSTSQVIEEYLYDPTVTTSTTGYTNGTGLVNGMCVFIYGGYNQSTNTTTAATGTNAAVVAGSSYGSQTGIPVIRKTSIAAALFGIVGVVVNAPNAATILNASTPTVTGGYTPGQVVQVCVQGIAGMLFDANNVTPGKFGVWGTTTPGVATYSATITAGETFGTPLAYLAAPTNNGLVPTYINLQ